MGTVVNVGLIGRRFRRDVDHDLIAVGGRVRHWLGIHIRLGDLGQGIGATGGDGQTLGVLGRFRGDVVWCGKILFHGHLERLDDQCTLRGRESALDDKTTVAVVVIVDESNEDYLLMIAKHGTAYHVEKLISKYRRVKRLQNAEVARQQHADRHAHRTRSIRR